MTLGMLPDAARDELLALFPDLASAEAPALRAARPLMKGWETALLAASL